MRRFRYKKNRNYLHTEHYIYWYYGLDLFVFDHRLLVIYRYNARMGVKNIWSYRFIEVFSGI